MFRERDARSVLGVEHKLKWSVLHNRRIYENGTEMWRGRVGSGPQAHYWRPAWADFRRITLLLASADSIRARADLVLFSGQRLSLSRGLPRFYLQNLIEYCRRSATLKKGVSHSNPKFSIAYTNFAGRRYTDARQGSELELARNLPLTSPLFEKLFPMFFIPKGFGPTGAGNRKSSSQISRH